VLNICPSARIKYPSPCQQHEENRQAGGENINQKPPLPGRIFLDLFTGPSPRHARLGCMIPAEHLLQEHPTTRLGLNVCKQGAFVRPMSLCLCWPSPSWGRVPGRPPAHGRDSTLDPGALGWISSLATGFLCGLGQIIRCEARSQFADILREPWFGR